MRVIRLVLTLVVLFAAFVGVGLFMLPKERIAKLASEQLSRQLGRDVEITGDLGLSFYPVLGVKTGPVRVAGAEWMNERQLLKAEALNIGVNAVAALRQQIEIERIEMVRPEINLIRTKSGAESWSFGESSGSDGEPSGGVREFNLKRAEIRGGKVLYEDRAAGTVEKLTGLNAVLAIPDIGGPLTLDASGVRGTGALKVSLRAENARDFIAGKLVPTRLDVSTQGGSVVFNGQMTQALEMDGQLAVKASDTSAFLTALGLGAADIPRGLGQSVDLATRLIFTGGDVVNLRGMVLGLDQNEVKGDADIRLTGDLPEITAKLTAGTLDFSALASDGGGGGSGGGSGGWSKTPIDAGGLAAANAKVSLSAASIDAGMIQLGDARIGVTLDRSRAVFKLNQAAGYGGTLAGQFVVNNRNGLSVGGDMSIAQGDVQALLRDLMSVERLTGRADAYVKFLGVGQTLDQIMRSLSGNGGIAMGQGTISGFDLNALMGNLENAGGTTVFDKLSASFDIKGGVLRNDNMTMNLPKFTASGKGQADLGQQTVNYLFTPVALQGRGGKGLAIPVRIRGPWANVKVVPDVSAAIDLNLAEEKARAKAKVETKVKKKLQEKLGVSVEDGQKVEDAIMKKAEDKLKKELLKIFE